jgi:putative pyruvate formate lyase activating enzyme
MNPGYTSLTRNELTVRASKAFDLLAECNLCPRQCGVNRLEEELGYCRTGHSAVVAAAHLHFGEEAPLVGNHGSGTIFFAGCNLCCVFCQNYDISHDTSQGQKVTPEQLAGIMLDLQSQEALNINLVTPTHVVPQILKALVFAAQQGLMLPLVYNCSGYEKIQTLRLLEGIVDIYMPDIKFFDPQPAAAYCRAEDYPQRARDAVKEMHRQVGDLELDEAGTAVRGLLVRHLLMPDKLAGTSSWLHFLAREVSTNTYINIMDQYRPCGRAWSYPELCEPVPAKTRKDAVALARSLGLCRIDPGPARRLQELFKLIK